MDYHCCRAYVLLDSRLLDDSIAGDLIMKKVLRDFYRESTRKRSLTTSNKMQNIDW
jgi:hypothetical protein